MSRPLEVFRFISGVAPRRRRDAFVLAFNTDTSFNAELRLALQRPDPVEGALRIVGQFERDTDFQRVVLEIVERSQLLVLRRRYAEQPPTSMAEANALIEQVLGQTATAIRSDSQFEADLTQLTDILVAIKIRSLEQRQLAANATQLLQMMNFVELCSNTSPHLDFESPLRNINGPIELPEEVFPFPAAFAADVETEPVELQDTSAIELRIRQVNNAMSEIAGLDSSDLRVSETTISEPSRGHASTTIASSADDQVGTINRSSTSRVVISNSARIKLSDSALELFSDLNITFGESSIVQALDRLNLEQTVLENSIEEALTTSARTHINGSTLVVGSGADGPLFMEDVQIPVAEPPTTVGSIRPTGLGKLLVVRQQIIRYEAGEISHVENVMRSETRNRETRRLRRTEETFLIEQEEKQEDERDLQTTERLEMQSEVQNTLKEDKQFNVGASISGGYGPFVQAEASTAYETSSSSEQSSKASTEYAKEVIDKTTSRITKRVRTEQTRKTIEEFEDKNSHGFDNVDGEEHAVGIYQWLDRVYEMQVYDYGLRLMFEFVVPQPAALLINAMESQIVKPEGLEMPKKITFGPHQLTRGNYSAKVETYQAEGVQAPPLYHKTIGQTFSFTSETGEARNHVDEALLNIPDGYKATEAHLEAVLTGPGSSLRYVVASVGNRHLYIRFNAENEFDYDIVDPLDSFTGEIPVALFARNIETYTATITIICVHTNHSFQQWQLETYDAIQRGYEKQRAAYEETIATLAVEQSIGSQGRNPASNRMIERNELKRLAITMLTGQHFDTIGVPLSHPHTRFNFDRAKSEGEYAQFWEKALEWPFISYEFLPYFWGPKDTWIKMIHEDADPLHAQFLRSGAALIRLTVSPGFEAAVLHFLETGAIWKGGEIPEAFSNQFIAFLDEVEARQDEIDVVEEPVGQPWEVKVPTSLVRLRSTNTLPEWELDEAGNWHSVDEQ